MAAGDYDWESKEVVDDAGKTSTDYDCVSENCWEFWTGAGLLGTGAFVGLMAGASTKSAFAKKIDEEEVASNKHKSYSLKIKIQKINTEISTLKRQISHYD